MQVLGANIDGGCAILCAKRPTTRPGTRGDRLRADRGVGASRGHRAGADRAVGPAEGGAAPAAGLGAGAAFDGASATRHGAPYLTRVPRKVRVLAGATAHRRRARAARGEPGSDPHPGGCARPAGAPRRAAAPARAAAHDRTGAAASARGAAAALAAPRPAGGFRRAPQAPLVTSTVGWQASTRAPQSPWLADNGAAPADG